MIKDYDLLLHISKGIYIKKGEILPDLRYA